MNAQSALLHKGFEPQEYIKMMIYTPEEEGNIKDIRTSIEAHVKETVIDFITGNRDIYDDAEWQKYLNEFYSLKLSELLEVAQKAYDRTK
mgnify:CR=1 FL=1